VGWSQRDLARRCGVAQPSLSNIESGDRDTTVATLGRILKAAQYSLVGVPTTRPTIADWAVRLATLARDDPGGVEKSLVQIVDDFGAVEPATRVGLCITPPPSTGDRALDGVLAGLVEFLLSREGLPVPGWVEDPDRQSPTGWDLVTIPGLRELARESTPESFRRRNVFVPADFLLSA
jgi:transcriptional regulator with XRE-family HTH domain